MKNLFIFSMLIALFASCGKGYRIEGSVGSDILDGMSVYVKSEINGAVVKTDSAVVEKSRFFMAGSVDSSFMASLYIGEQPVVPFVVEPGNINIHIAEELVSVKGTPLNNELWALMQQKIELEKRMYELERAETAMILEGATAEAAAEFMGDSITYVGESMERLMNGFIRENLDNVLGPCVFALFYSAVNIPIVTAELESIYNDAPETFRNDSFVEYYYEIARENSRRMRQGGLNEE